MFLVKFRFEDGEELAVPALAGENLLKVASRARVPIDAPCAGLGSCGRCRVRVLSGSLDAPPSFYLSDADYAEGWRLACASRINGDVCVLVE